MKKIVLTLLILAIGIEVQAQCFVYETNGDAYVRQKEGWTEAYKTLPVGLSDSIRTDNYSSIVILDRGKNESYSFQCTKPTTLQTLISSHQKESNGLLKEFIAGVYAAMFETNEKSMEAYTKKGGVVYRDEDHNLIVAQSLAASKHISPKVSFRILDYKTELPITEVKTGDFAIIEITNNTNLPLFFNIADFDSGGNASPILPFDSQQNMMHLFLPSYSVVRLYDYPVEFFEPRGTDQLVLIAYPKPYNLMTVLQKLESVNPVPSSDVFLSSLPINIL